MGNKWTSFALLKTRAVSLMKTLKFHIPCKLMQSGWERSRVHYCRYIWINYRPSALQRFHVTVLSWNEADALCGLPEEQSALFISAARGKVRRRVRRGRESKTRLTSGWTQSESNSNISCIGSLNTKEKQSINVNILIVLYIISVLIHCQTDICSIIAFTLLFRFIGH